MSVYIKESHVFLKRSIESVMAQEMPPTDFVIVCDGPLSKELEDCLLQMKKQYPIINILRLPNNMGLGTALSEGLKIVSNNYVMRMDSDDVCLPDRATVQIPMLKNYDLVGGIISEFENDEKNIIGYRVVPEFFKDIKRYSKKRNPFNHPSVAFKKDVILSAGGYQDLLYVEDYYLWVRVLLATNKVYNIQKVLVNMRSGAAMRSRRGGKIYKKSLKKLRKYMLDNHLINIIEYYLLLVSQNIFLSLPLRYKSRLYKKVLRK